MAEYYGEGSVAVSPSQVPVGEQIHPSNANPDYRKLLFTYTVGAHGLPANKGAGIRISGYSRGTNDNRNQTLFSLFDAAKVSVTATVESPPGTPYSTGFTVAPDSTGKQIDAVLTTRALNEGDLIKVEVASAADAGSEEGFFVSGCSTSHWMKAALKWEVKSRTADNTNGGWLWPDVPLAVRQQTGTCPGSGTSTTIRFDSNASSVDGFYNGWVVWLTNGAGIGQKRVVTAYNGGSREATVSEGWDTGQVPDATTTYDLKGWAETKLLARDPAKIRVSVRGLRQGSDILWLSADGKTEVFDILVSVLDNWGNIDEDYAGTITLAAKKSDGSSCGSSGISQVVFDGSEGGYKEVTRVWLTELPSNGFAWIEATASGLVQVEARPILLWETAPPYHEVFGDYHCHSRTDHSNAYGEPQAALRYQQLACLLDWQSLGDHSLGGSSQELLPYWAAEYVTEQARHPGLCSQEASSQEGDEAYDDGTYTHYLFYENRAGDFAKGSVVQGWGRIRYINRNAYAFQVGETVNGYYGFSGVVKQVIGATAGWLAVDQTSVTGLAAGEQINGVTSGAAANVDSVAGGFQQAARAVIAWAEDNRDGSGNRLTRGQLTLIDLSGHFHTGDTISEKRTGGATARVAELAWGTQYADPPFAVGDGVSGYTSGASGTVRWIGPKKRLRLENVSGYFLPATSDAAETLRVGGAAKAVYQQGDDNGGGEGLLYKHVCILQAGDHAVNLNPGDGRSDGDVAADINHRLCRDIVLARGRNATCIKHLHGRLLHNWLEGGRLWVDNNFYPLIEAMSDVAQFTGPQFAITSDGRPDTGDDWGLLRYGCYWAWRHGFKVGFAGGSDNHNGHAGSLWWRGHMLDVHAKRVGGADVAGIPDWPDEAGITGVLLPWDATAYADGDLMEAMRERRTLAMSGHKSKLYCKLTLGGNDYAPGSIITGSGSQNLSFTIRLMTSLPELNLEVVRVVRYQLKPSANLGYEATDLLSADPAARAYVNTQLTDTITLGTGDNTLWVYYVWFRLSRWDPEDEDEPQHWGVASPWYLEYAG